MGAGGLGPGHRRAARRWGPVTGLGPHERGLLRGLQPREERSGFKGPSKLILVIWREPRAKPQAGPAPPAGPRARRGHLSQRAHSDLRASVKLGDVPQRTRLEPSRGSGNLSVGVSLRKTIKDGSKGKTGSGSPRESSSYALQGVSRLEGALSRGPSRRPPPRSEEHVAICQDLARFPYEGPPAPWER